MTGMGKDMLNFVCAGVKQEVRWIRTDCTGVEQQSQTMCTGCTGLEQWSTVYVPVVPV